MNEDTDIRRLTVEELARDMKRELTDGEAFSSKQFFLLVQITRWEFQEHYPDERQRLIVMTRKLLAKIKAINSGQSQRRDGATMTVLLWLLTETHVQHWTLGHLWDWYDAQPLVAKQTIRKWSLSNQMRYYRYEDPDLDLPLLPMSPWWRRMHIVVERAGTTR